MALHHRKFLLAGPDKPSKKYASPCYMCYVCPENCYISPPPPPLQYISPPPPPPLIQPSASQKHQFSTILILMLCVLGACFLFLSYLTIYRYRLTSSRRRNSLENDTFGQDFVDENHGPFLDHPIWYIRTIGFSQSIIDSITAFKFKKEERLMEGSECSVCLNEFQEDEILRLLPKCSHAFHVNCIDTWLRSHKNCPVCRAPIVINRGSSANSNSVEISSSDTGLIEENQEWGEAESDENSSQTRPQENELVLESICVDSERKGKFRVLSDLGDHREKVDQDLELTKRSVSMDFSSSSMVYTKRDEGCSGYNLQKVEELTSSDMVSKRKWLMKSYSQGRFIQKGPVSMKRSFSFSGKRSLRKNSRSLESISIPELSIS